MKTTGISASIIFFLLAHLNVFSQMLPAGQVIDNFEDNTLTNWTVPAAVCVNSYTLTESNQELRVDFSINQPECYDKFYKNIPSTNFTTNSILCFKLKSETSTFIKLQVELQDNVGRITNATPFITYNPTIVPIDGNNPNGIYYEYCFNFTDWNQVWPGPAVVDRTQITRINFYVNGNSPAAGFYTGGTLWIDDLVVRSNNPLPAAGGTFYSNGSAANYSSSSTTSIYRLTDDNGLFQSTAVFNKTAHDWTTNFDAYFNVYLGCYDPTGADGISFFLMNDASELTNTGGGGGGCGYGLGQRNYIEFPKSLAIELDTWDNTVDGMTNDVAGASSDDHLAINFGGHENNLITATRVNMGNLEDNAIHLLRVNYTASTSTIRIYFDGTLRLTKVYNIANYFNTGSAPFSTTAYWGFTGSTGGSKNEQWFSYNGTSTPPTYVTACSVSLPVELTSFTGYQQNKDVNLNWTTVSEFNNDYFEIQKSMDAASWVSLEQMEGKGISNSMTNYSYTDNTPGEGLVYYRLKQVDISGAVNYSSVIAIRLTSEEILPVSIYPIPANDLITISLPAGGKSEISFLDVAGQEVYHATNDFSASPRVSLSITNLKEGFYVVKVKSQEKEFRSSLLIIK